MLKLLPFPERDMMNVTCDHYTRNYYTNHVPLLYIDQMKLYSIWSYDHLNLYISRNSCYCGVNAHVHFLDVLVLTVYLISPHI